MASRGQNHGNGKNNQAYAPKPKILPAPKRKDPGKDSICHECGETGHRKRNCPQYIAELLKKKKNVASGAGGSGIFVIELNTILNRSWIYDIGRGTHICNTMQGLRASRKLKPRALNLYVGNGQREAVEAIGVFYLCLPSGLEIVLNNCHYAPSITRVISVSCLYEDGFINHFVNNTIQVSRNNMVYFSAIPRDGIFEIDLSNSYTNESSIYAHKHEVFETFKVFQKEVENQHGSWNITHRTPSYTPQHNDVSERRNKTLLDMVRSMMSQTTLPKSFWDYALETAAHILNMVPTKKLSFLLMEKPLVASGSSRKRPTWMELYTPINLVLWQRAILNGYLNEELYMEQPEGFVNLKYLNLNSKCGSIHMQEKLKLSKSQGASTPAELKRIQNVPYALAVGSTMYAVRCTRPDVVFAQNVTSRFQQNPGDLHWTTVKNILKYLRNTKEMFLTGYVFVLNGGAIDWKSARQSIFATLSAEAKYITAFDASKEAIWVRKFISGLGVVPTIEEPISMYCDNTEAIAIANESGITKGARHFRAKVHYLRTVIEYGDIKLEKVHTDDNLADPFTKALAFPKHSERTRNIGMLPASSLI
nr:hypothetical protein [Tanacetum cinerariifolium]